MVLLWGDLIRVALAAFVVSWIALEVTQHVVVARYAFDRLHMNDFGKFYYSAQAFAAGGDMYGPGPATRLEVGPTESRAFWNLNPPHFHLLILPFAALPEALAFLSWMVVNIVVLLVALRVITRELGLRWSVAGVLWTTAIAVSSSVAGIVVVTGQITCVLMLVVTLAWRRARHGQWTRAGLLLGVAASVKPFVGLFWLYLIVQRRWRAVAAMTAASAGCFALGVLVFGWTAHLRWIEVLSSVTWLWAPMNGSLGGWLERVFTDTPFFTPVIRAPGIVGPLIWLLGSAVVAASLLLLRADPSPEAADRGFALTLLAAQLASPLGWFYYILTGLGPFAIIWRSMPRHRSPGRNVALILATPGLFLPLGFTMIGRTDPVGGMTWGSLYTWTTLLLWIGVALDARAAARATQPPPDGSFGA